MKLKNKLSKYIDYLKEDKVFFGLIFLLFLNLSCLTIFQGIILNDEVILYERRLKGWFYLTITGIKGEFIQGRPLRSMAAINAAITNISSNMYFNRAIQMVIFGVLLYSLFKLFRKIFSNKVAKIWLLLSLSCIPILFEHGVPNAYNGITFIPFLELSISLHYWINYLENSNKNNLIKSIIFWTLALCGYEFIVTYTPIFILIYLFKKNKFNMQVIVDSLKNCFWFCLIGVAYLILTFLLQRIINVTYDGVTMNFTNIRSMFRVIYVLFLSSMPGSYKYHGKYNYLINIYKNDLIKWQFISLAPIFLIVIYLITLLFIDNKKINDNKYNIGILRFILIIFCLCCYTIIPLLPNSVTTMYQDITTFEAFSWFPVSIFTYFTICLIIAYILSIIINKNKRIGLIIILLFVCFISIPVQYMNIVIANRHISNYNRFKNITDVLQTQTISKINDLEIVSENIFDTNDLFAVHDSFWNSISNTNGLNIVINKYDENNERNENGAWLSFLGDEYFCLATKNEAVILSKKRLNGTKLLEVYKDQFIIVKLDEGLYDNGFNVYRFILKDNEWISVPEASEAFSIYSRKVGSNKEGIISIYGIEEDSWVRTESEFFIKALDKGIVDLEVYMPDYNKKDDRSLVIIVNDNNVQKFKLNSKRSNIKINVSPLKRNNIKIISDFAAKKNNGDIRELSWILSDINAY